MEPIQKVRQISQKEAREIDANNVDFFTLTDGTIVRIKGEGEASYGSGAQIKEGQPILSQISRNPSQSLIQRVQKDLDEMVLGNER